MHKSVCMCSAVLEPVKFATRATEELLIFHLSHLIHHIPPIISCPVAQLPSCPVRLYTHHGVAVWVRNTLHRLLCLKTWHAAHGAVWEDGVTVRRWSLVEVVHWEPVLEFDRLATVLFLLPHGRCNGSSCFRVLPQRLHLELWAKENPSSLE